MPTPTSNPELPAVRERSFAFVPRLDRTRRAIQALDQQAGLRAPWLIASFLLAALLIFLRGPSLFTHAQFWAEDGAFWYAQAYNGGWLHSLTLPDGGYLNTLQRVAAGLALLVPFRWAPLVMASVGLVIQALPVPILLSYRCSRWSALSMRIAFAAAYVAMPNAHEIHVVCTNSHFHFAFIEVLLAFSVAPQSLRWRCFDVVIFLLAGVCGPFAIILLPLLAGFWWIRRQPWTRVQLILVALTTIPQVYVLRSVQAARHARALGASLSMFIRMVGGDCFLGTLRGSTPYGLKYPLIVSFVSLAVCVTVCIYCLRFVSLETRLFFLYSFLVLAASLRSPLAGDPTLSPWNILLRYGASLRYWFFPSLPLLFAVLWCVCYARSLFFKGLGVLLTALLIQGIVRDWRIPPLIDLHFPEYAAQFEAAPSGTHVTIPLNPPPGWSMEITKK